jgi:hypothetical protein
MISELANNIFKQSIKDYHQFDNIDQSAMSPYDAETLSHLLYLKNWIDTAQWHMEDVVRNPSINPVEGLEWKRRIDAQNQVRTDMVEFIDSYFLKLYAHITPKENAKINTESVAWAIDRLSILALKIYHMQEEVDRADASLAHKQQCQTKLDILLAQRTDLSNSIDELIADIEAGNKYMKVYKQMKMYNDPSLNPILYNQVK